MNVQQSRQLVLVSLVITSGVVIYDLNRSKDTLGTEQSFRAIWSLGLLALLMGILADLLPQLAGPFAGLVALSVVVGRKGVLRSIVAAGNAVSPSGRKAAPSTSPGLTSRPEEGSRGPAPVAPPASQHKNN